MEEHFSSKIEKNIKDAFSKKHNMPAHRKAQLDDLIQSKIAEYQQDERIEEYYQEEIASVGMDAHDGGFGFGKFFQTMAAMATMGMLLVVVLLITLLNIDFLKTEELSSTEFASTVRVEPIAFSETGGVDVDTKFLIEADIELDADELEDVLEIIPEVEFTVVADNDNFTIFPLEELEENTDYQIRIPEGTELGDTTITDAIVWEFTTEEGLQIEEINLVESENYGPVVIAQLNFTGLDIDSLDGNILTLPAIEFSEYVVEDESLIMVPENPEQLFTQIDIAFDKGISNENGKNLADVFVFSLNGDLATPDDLPRVNFSHNFIDDRINLANGSEEIRFNVLPFEGIDGELTSGEPVVTIYEVNKDTSKEAALLLMRWRAIFSRIEILPMSFLQEVTGYSVEKVDNTEYVIQFDEIVDRLGTFLVVVEYEEESVFTYISTEKYRLTIGESDEGLNTNIEIEEADVEVEEEELDDSSKEKITSIYYIDEQGHYQITTAKDVEKINVEAIVGGVVHETDGRVWIILADFVKLDLDIKEEVEDEIVDIIPDVSIPEEN